MICPQALLAGGGCEGGVGFVSKQATRPIELLFWLLFAFLFNSSLSPSGKHSTLPTITTPSPDLMTSITMGPMGSRWHKFTGRWNRNSNGWEYSLHSKRNVNAWYQAQSRRIFWDPSRQRPSGHGTYSMAWCYLGDDRGKGKTMRRGLRHQSTLAPEWESRLSVKPPGEKWAPGTQNYLFRPEKEHKLLFF